MCVREGGGGGVEERDREVRDCWGRRRRHEREYKGERKKSGKLTKEILLLRYAAVELKLV